MPLGMDVGLGPSEFVLHGVRAKMALSVEVSLGPGHIVLGTQLLPQNGAQQPPLFDPCLFWPNSFPSKLLLSSC